MQDLALIVKGIIKKRRTIDPDSFNGKTVDKSIILDMLESANWAPNHGQTEPWHFIVYENEKISEFGKLHAELYKELTPAEQFLDKKYEKLLHRGKKASYLIIVCMKRGNRSNIPELEEIEAVACAAQNMLLVATANAVGTYWGTGGMCYSPELRDKLGLGSSDKVLGFIYVGQTNDPLVDGKRNTAIHHKVRWV
jgi:nitroreductase